MDFSCRCRSIQAEASQAGAVILGLCLPEWGTVSDAAVEPPIPSSTGVLHQVPGESSGSDSVSGERHGQQGEKAAAGTSARLSCACQPGGCTGEAQMALSASPGVPVASPLLWGSHGAVTAACDSPLPWDPPAWHPSLCQGSPPCLSQLRGDPIFHRSIQHLIYPSSKHKSSLYSNKTRLLTLPFRNPCQLLPLWFLQYRHLSSHACLFFLSPFVPSLPLPCRLLLCLVVTRL